MGNSEPRCPDLSLEQCVAKAKAWLRLTNADPLGRHIILAWEDESLLGSGPHTLARFLRQPEGPFFSAHSRSWHAKFLRLNLNVAMRRMEDL